MIVCVVLAAGGSTRLGAPKQLVRYEGRTLVEHVTAQLAPLGPVMVVSGAVPLPGSVHNARWQEGAASSLHTGVHAALGAHPALTGLVVATCDQPLIPPSHYEALASGLGTHAITCSAYAGVQGVPAAFSRAVLRELLEVTGDRGAREVIRRDPSRVLAIPCETAQLDVDTPQDVARLRDSRS